MQTEMSTAAANGLPEAEAAPEKIDFELIKKRAEEELSELRWTRLLLKSLLLLSLIYFLVVGVWWIGGFAAEQIPVLVSKIFS